MPPDMTLMDIDYMDIQQKKYIRPGTSIILDQKIFRITCEHEWKIGSGNINNVCIACRRSIRLEERVKCFYCASEACIICIETLFNITLKNPSKEKTYDLLLEQRLHNMQQEISLTRDEILLLKDRMYLLETKQVHNDKPETSRELQMSFPTFEDSVEFNKKIQEKERQKLKEKEHQEDPIIEQLMLSDLQLETPLV